ncbi:dTDP-4-dehydrorhamnose reductase [Aestuariivirga sp.]|jgi:dTDP-4-dehydrorhamnose reductase|uniref:dTDP-4-dehydrorhamnose reductase n=1 Tax=Aestuariivirga sp. TaxID=2650926 RepID=UPI003782E0C4
MRILVTGRSGQVVMALLERSALVPGVEVIALGRPDLDLEDTASAGAAIAAVRPDMVVNAAAYTAVDKAEQESALAFAINRDGAAAAAAAAARLGAAFIQLSTDYVYPGDKTGAYVESDETGPLGVYGQSKLAGEEAVKLAHPSPLILRTSWVYSPFGGNFVKTMLRLGKERAVLNVVDDQIGNPTSALDIAHAVLRIAPGLPGGGTYHLCGSGDVTWYGLARETFALSKSLGGPCAEVKPITTAEYPTPARRPANSRLSMDAFAARFGFRLRPLQEALAETVSRLV